MTSTDACLHAELAQEISGYWYGSHSGSGRRHKDSDLYILLVKWPFGEIELWVMKGGDAVCMCVCGEGEMCACVCVDMGEVCVRRWVEVCVRIWVEVCVSVSVWTGV